MYSQTFLKTSQKPKENQKSMMMPCLQLLLWGHFVLAWKMRCLKILYFLNIETASSNYFFFSWGQQIKPHCSFLLFLLPQQENIKNKTRINLEQKQVNTATIYSRDHCYSQVITNKITAWSRYTWGTDHEMLGIDTDWEMVIGMQTWCCLCSGMCRKLSTQHNSLRLEFINFFQYRTQITGTFN